MAHNGIMEYKAANKVLILKTRENEHSRKLGGKIKLGSLDSVYNCNCKIMYTWIRNGRE